MKVVTMGEIMLRLAPSGYLRFLQADSFEATFGGGEANVAVSLSNFGFETEFVTKLPKNEIGDAAVNSLRKYGVGVKHIARGGERVGIYFLEKGASQRASKVIYDRANSSIATASEKDFNWQNIFAGADWFHITGITPALSEGMAETSITAAKYAKEHGIKVSCDLNYRKKLWSKEKAGEVMAKLLKYVDIVIANEEDCADMFNIKAENSSITGGELSKEGYKAVAKEMVKRFNLEAIAITLRGSLSANDNTWQGMYYDGNDFYFSKEYKIHIVDRVGGGDSFGAGLIYSKLSNSSPQNTIEFAVAASALKHTIEGDFNLVSVDEVQSLLKGNGSGRVQR